MRLKVNLVLLADAYKYCHWLQLPEGVEKMVAYIESRGTKLNINYTSVFGLQGFIKDYLKGKVLKKWMIDEAAELLGEVFGTDKYFNKAGFESLLKKYKGKLPVRICAVREGTKVPLHNVLVTIESTDKEFAWIVPWIETMLLRASWYPKAVCTISSAVRDLEREFGAICGSGHNPFFLNDFGARGASSHESAEIGGSAHLVNFLGTDTMEAVRWAKARYGKSANGYSVFASEHSTTTIYGKLGELIAYRNFLTRAPSDKIVSIVVDSYDTEHAVKNLLGGKLYEFIINRNAPTVFRPDSGDPVEMSLKVMTWLWEIFGGTINKKGFKVLNPKVKVIYGDGINLVSIRAILQNLVDNGFSIENIVFGMGGKLLQGVDRDSFMDACKLCYAEINGVGVDIFKEPKTDKVKASKKGLMKLVVIDGEYKTVATKDYPTLENHLIEIFLNGDLKVDETFDVIRERASK